MTLLIQEAYKVRPFQIQGLPAWADSDRFNLTAKVRTETKPGPVNSKSMEQSFEEMEPMLQTLLEERFAMKVHRETKEMPVYFVTLAKNGPKLKESACIEFDRDNPPKVEPGQKVTFCNNLRGGRNGGNRTIDASGVTVPVFATRFLAQEVGRTVIDKTEYPHKFDLKLEWFPGMSETNAAPENQAPSLFSALQAAGLKLEAGRGQVEVLVIDHIEKLSSN